MLYQEMNRAKNKDERASEIISHKDGDKDVSSRV